MGGLHCSSLLQFCRHICSTELFLHYLLLLDTIVELNMFENHFDLAFKAIELSFKNIGF